MNMKCRFCNKECKNKNSLSNHERLCKNNPNRQDSNLKFLKQPWNKGLTKETDIRVLLQSKNLSEMYKGKAPKFEWTEERRNKKSEWAKQRFINNPELHPNRKLSGNRKKMSNPEKEVYDWLTSNGYSFEHNKKILDFYPDFVIDKTIIEVDGSYWHKNKQDDAERDILLENEGYKVYRIRIERGNDKSLLIQLKEILGVA